MKHIKMFETLKVIPKDVDRYKIPRITFTIELSGKDSENIIYENIIGGLGMIYIRNDDGKILTGKLSGINNDIFKHKSTLGINKMVLEIVTGILTVSEYDVKVDNIDNIEIRG